jgi:hypothetical protein
MAPPIWQELALMPDQKRTAIELYMQEHSVNSVEAKRAVDEYLNKPAGTPASA